MARRTITQLTVLLRSFPDMDGYSNEGLLRTGELRMRNEDENENET